MRSLGPGFRFHPTDVELIMYYLTRKVMRRKFHRDGIRVLDVYKFAPWDLQGQARWKRDLKCYFFCPRERKYSTGERTNRSTEHGFWKTTGKDRSVHYNGEIVGMIKSLIFHTRNPTQRTNWVMHEYKLRDEYLKHLGLEEDVFVLCVIFVKEGPGPRNGAQYGGPYRDEDWDDDNDCDTDDELDNRGEDTNVVGALTQVHTDEGESTVPNDFERADGYFVGSSSRTLPSDVDQSVNHGFPPTPVPGTLFIESQLPLSDECDIFVDKILSALPENEQAQDIGVDGDIKCEPSIPANEEKIYDGLEDFCRLDDFADSDAGAHGCDVLATQNIQIDDYLELADCMDVSSPFEGSHDHDHSGPGQPSPSFGPVIPDGVPVSILVGQQNLNVRILGSMLSWNGHLQEPAETERPINDPQTGLSRFRSSNFPDSSSSGLHIPCLDQCPPVFEGSMRSNVLPGYGEYGPFWQDPHFSDGLGGQGFGDNLPYLNQHHHLASGPIGFGDQYFGENVPYLNPHHQFAPGPVAFVGQSLRGNVTSLHGPQFAEDSVGLSVQGFEENESHMNQHYQTADGSIGFHCQEASMNGQVDHHFDSVGTAARFGIVQPPQSMPRGEQRIMFCSLRCILGSLAPVNGAKRWDGYAISFPYGESSVRVKTEVNPFGLDWRTNDALSNGLEDVTFVTVECNRNGNDTSGKVAVLHMCGHIDIELSVLLAVFCNGSPLCQGHVLFKISTYVWPDSRVVKSIHCTARRALYDLIWSKWILYAFKPLFSVCMTCFDLNR